MLAVTLRENALTTLDALKTSLGIDPAEEDAPRDATLVQLINAASAWLETQLGRKLGKNPDFSQDFDGIERRLVIFEFKHVFTNGDPLYDSAILDKLSADECMSALLNKAIRGYRSLVHSDGFINTEESKRALEDFVSDNDNVVKWLRESEIDTDWLLNEPINLDCGGSYPTYREFCYSIGEEPKEQKDFSRTICNRYGWKTATKRFNGKRPQFFKQK